jgi:Pregnancy-associated plasma protein-A/Secretion system C-terminal sorting domain
MKLLNIIVLSSLCINSLAQQRTCATMDVLSKQIAADPNLQARMDAIENQTANFVKNFNDKATRQIIQIPVVVHVLHNGEPVGTGANISQAQILSQLDALNEDYRKKNSDSLPSNHPFWSVTADPEIQFCLATVAPDKTASTGVLRYNIGVNSVSDADMDAIVKPQTIWDHNLYLNIWVCNVTAQNSILGYAQFPGGSANTDGVVILTTAFGYTGNVQAPYDNGRTTVHEVGHWLNLRHIWGDANCGNDFVTDTKPAEQANYGCKTFPYNANFCNGTDANGEMFMNYMDYSNDACMVMFTKGQKARMLAALNGSRSGLKTSIGCGVNVAINDAPQVLQTVTIFPNPVHDFCEIQVPLSTSNYEISVSNIDGKTIKQIVAKEINGLIKVDMQSIPQGVYIVKINNGTAEAVRKVVKK